QPAFDRALIVGGGDLDATHLAQAASAQEIGVQTGQLGAAAALQDVDVGRAAGIAARIGDGAVVGHGEAAAGVGTAEVVAGQIFDQGGDRAVQRHAGDLGAALVVIGDIDRAAVAAPHRRLDRTVEIPGQDAAVRAVGVHHMKAGVVIAHPLVVVAEVGDATTVGRCDGRIVRPRAVGKG